MKSHEALNLLKTLGFFGGAGGSYFFPFVTLVQFLSVNFVGDSIMLQV